MKKHISTCVIAALLAVCTGGCGVKEPETITITNHAEIISQPADMSLYMWIEKPYADFQKISFDELNGFFEKKGSGILYLGYDGCQWCERGIPELNTVAREHGVTVYYCETDPYAPAEEFITEDQWNKLIENIGSVLTKSEDGEPQLFVPLVIGVKNGEITGSHTALVDSFDIINEDDQMNDSEKKELQKIYLDIMKKTAD